MKRALLVGIDAYPSSPLSGCVNDAHAMHDLLQCNDDASPNFDCKLLVAPSQAVTQAVLLTHLERLFARPADVALFYFSGHGTVDSRGAHLSTQSGGVSITDVLTLAAQNSVREVVIVLDCCFSGALGSVPAIDDKAELALLREGLSILTASRPDEPSEELSGEGDALPRGLFTSLVCDALAGGAADVIGDVTVAGVYAYVDQ